MDLRPHKPIFDWESIECILHIGNRTERIAEHKRLWPMRFPTPHRKAATPPIALTMQEDPNASPAQEASERPTTPEPPAASGSSGTKNKKRNKNRKAHAPTLWQWHQRLGHLNNEDIKRLTSCIEIKISDTKERFCEPCRYGKQIANPSHTSRTRAKARLDRIHINLISGGATLPPIIKTINILNPGTVFEEKFDYELINITSIKDARYFMLITDDYSRYR
jgi:hypothetical protein